MKKDKISVAMVAPPFGDTGGPEVVVQNLTDAFLKIGIDVTLYAPADWKTRAKHKVTLKESIWSMKDRGALNNKEFRELKISSQESVLRDQNNFDLIHLHSQRYAAAIAKKTKVPCVVSFHNKIKTEQYAQAVASGLHIVALSKFQQGKLKTEATIHNGVPIATIKPSYAKGDYLMFVGRLTDQKGVDVAIQIALKSQKKLLIFGRIGNTTERRNFFATAIEPFLDDEKVIYKGEVTHAEIYEYLCGAAALLFPIRRPEVCPMSVMESLACGTPIIGTRIEPLSELLNDSRIAFLSDDFTELVKAVQNVEQFDRKVCRKYAEENFDSLVMAKKYLVLYEKILKKQKRRV